MKRSDLFLQLSGLGGLLGSSTGPIPSWIVILILIIGLILAVIRLAPQFKGMLGKLEKMEEEGGQQGGVSFGGFGKR